MRMTCVFVSAFTHARGERGVLCRHPRVSGNSRGQVGRRWDKARSSYTKSNSTVAGGPEGPRDGRPAGGTSWVRVV